MANMGKTPNKLMQDAVGEKPAYLKPPRGSSKKFRALWRMIIEDFPPTYFKESDIPVLEEFIHLKLSLEELRAQCEGEPYTYCTSSSGRTVINPIHTMRLNTFGRLASVGRSLRLMPSGRMKENQTPKESEWAKRRASKQKEQANTAVKLRLA